MTKHTFSFTRESGNIKTGAIPVTMTSRNSCPKSCAFYDKGCYAKSGPLSWHWKKVKQSFSHLIESIASLPADTFWRHNQAGDLVGVNEKINFLALKQIVKANKGKRGFTYTHKYNDKSNFKKIKFCNDNGFTVNLSANNVKEVDKLAKLKIAPVVVVLPENAPDTIITKAGNEIIVCPAQRKEGVTCSSCQLCQKVNRSVVVGFRAHGTAKKTVSKIAE